MKKAVILGIDCWYPQVDGVTNVVKNYRKNLRGGGFDCEIVAPSYGRKSDEEGEERYCGGVFHHFSLSVPFLSFRNSMPGCDKKLKKFLDERHPALLHAHSPFAICSYFERYGKRHNIPVVYTFHTKYRDEFFRVTHSRLITAIMMSVIMRNIRRADYVWAVSGKAAETLREYGYSGEIKVMPNGTDMRPAAEGERASLAEQVRKQYGISPDERIFLYTGRVVSVKNLKFSFEIVAELNKRGFKCRFFVVGGGDELEEHKKLASKLGVDDMVIFTGFVGDREALRRYYACADLFLLPSVFDNTPLVVLEAASLGTPSVVPAGSSAAELIEDGATGYCEELNVERWANRIMAIFSDEGKAAAVSKNCSSIACSWEKAVSDAEAEYRRIIDI